MAASCCRICCGSIWQRQQRQQQAIRYYARAFTQGRALYQADRSSNTAPATRRRTLWTAALATIVGVTGGYTLATLFPSRLAMILNPRQAPPSPAPESPEGIRHMQEMESQLQALPVVQKLRRETLPLQSAANEHDSFSKNQNPILQQGPKWIETRPYQTIPASRRTHLLTSGVLHGPGKFAVLPLVFSTRDNIESYIITHLGRSMCGHEGIIHGGLLATLMDEALGRSAILALPAQVGVTAYLHVDYKKPCFADQFVIVHTKCTKHEGRKAFAEGRIETLKGELICTANGLFVQPKMASLLSSDAVKDVLGVKDRKGEAG